ncbi:MAG: class I SAM-dependent methyltransferase [Geminicoccaceae bacterium]
MRDNLSISPWIQRLLHLVPEGGLVLDLAAGGGRHTAWCLKRGHAVTALDRRIGDLELLKMALGATKRSRLEIIQADLEDGSPWPLTDRRFDAVIVVNYLYRPLFPLLLAALTPGGVLLYDTFAVGQEMYGRPSNPDFLLKPDELLTAVQGRLQIVAYEHGLIDDGEAPAVKQRIAAVNDGSRRALTAP